MAGKAGAKPNARTKAARAWKEFYMSPEGKLAIGALMARFGVFGADLDPNNPTAMAIAHGQREVCAWIAQQIGMKDAVYVDVRNEFDDLTEKLINQYGAM